MFTFTVAVEAHTVIYFAPLAAAKTKPVRSNTPLGVIAVPNSIASLATNEPVGVPALPKLAPIYKRIVAGADVLVLVKLTLTTLYVLLGTT